MPSTSEILGLILGGGVGTRLYPLTRQRSKPAVPIAGKYRLIDIPISNCINSEITRIAILTQYNSVSLHRHIANTYNFDPFHHGWVEILAAEQTPSSDTWYQGTADAVRKQLFEIKATGAQYVLILSGDHIYRMDYQPMAKFHWDSNAEITVATQPVPASEASRYGILKRSSDGRITDFIEKPKSPDLLEQYKSTGNPSTPFLASMGVYLFNTQVLIELLRHDTYTDFGKDVIPAAIRNRNVYGFDFEGYWEDIGTIRSFYEVNLRLACPNPPFDFNDPARPIYTHSRFLPGSTVEGANLFHVLLADGCCIGKADISESVVGLRMQIKDGSRIKSTVLMGADYYDHPGLPPRGGIPLGIGMNCQIEGAIIDKNARIGSDVIIRPFPAGTDLDGDQWVVRDGIVVVPKSTVIQAGTVIGPD